MKLKFLAIVISLIIICCNKHNMNQDSSNNVDSNSKDTIKKENSIPKTSLEYFNYIDTSRFFVDTFLNLKAESLDNYLLVLVRDRYKGDTLISNDEWFSFSPLILKLINTSNKKVYTEKLKDNQFLQFFEIISSKDNSKNYFIALINTGGGSGYEGNLYKLNFDNNNKLKPVFDYGELSYFAVNKEANEWLVIHGIWNFEEKETHFEDHRYEIESYKMLNDSIEKTIFGKTKYKYSSMNFYMGLKEMIKKEPELFKSIDLSQFSFKDN
jgi:hypothetical protein